MQKNHFLLVKKLKNTSSAQLWTRNKACLGGQMGIWKSAAAAGESEGKGGRRRGSGENFLTSMLNPSPELPGLAFSRPKNKFGLF